MAYIASIEGNKITYYVNGDTAQPKTIEVSGLTAEKIKELESLNSNLLRINANQDEENKKLSEENLELKVKQEKIYEILKPRTN